MKDIIFWICIGIYTTVMVWWILVVRDYHKNMDIFIASNDKMISLFHELRKKMGP
jgi:hypothetical protein